MISRLHVPLIEPEDVVRHLGKQEWDWKEGRSAHALANLWHSANALPATIKSILASHPIFRSAELIDAFLERQVDLGTAGRHSQTDLLAIVGLEDQLAILAVEGKAGEPFGNEYVHQWLDGSENKVRRLTGLCETLGVPVGSTHHIRYQLLHRSVSAILEARRYRSKAAVVLVQSFAQDKGSFADFSEFLRVMGIKKEASPGVLLGPTFCNGVSVYFGWVDEKPQVSSTPTAYLYDLRGYADRLSRWCERVRNWCDGRLSPARNQ